MGKTTYKFQVILFLPKNKDFPAGEGGCNLHVCVLFWYHKLSLCHSLFLWWHTPLERCLQMVNLAVTEVDATCPSISVVNQNIFLELVVSLRPLSAGLKAIITWHRRDHPTTFTNPISSVPKKAARRNRDGFKSFVPFLRMYRSIFYWVRLKLFRESDKSWISSATVMFLEGHVSPVYRKWRPVQEAQILGQRGKNGIPSRMYLWPTKYFCLERTYNYNASV